MSEGLLMERRLHVCVHCGKLASGLAIRARGGLRYCADHPHCRAAAARHIVRTRAKHGPQRKGIPT